MNAVTIRTDMRRFILDRTVDISGASGTGCVAEGVQFTDGTVTLRWKAAPTSHAIYDSLIDLMAIHGHGGTTIVRWVDPPPRHIRPD